MNLQQVQRGTRNRTPRPCKGKTISEVITKAIFEPLLDSVQAAKLLGGIHPKTLQKKARQGAVRRTFATLLIANGEIIKVVQGAMGHSTSKNDSRSICSIDDT